MDRESFVHLTHQLLAHVTCRKDLLLTWWQDLEKVCCWEELGTDDGRRLLVDPVLASCHHKGGAPLSLIICIEDEFLSWPHAYSYL